LSTQLQLPIPDNLVAKGYRHVESDLYNICERIKEVSPRLRLIFHERHPKKPWVVMEDCADGVERFVARYAVPDARILENLRYMLAVPFDERMKKVEAEVEAHNEAHSEMDPEVIERMAYDMRRALVDANLSDAAVGRKQIRKKG
jgi:hypothetical protein